MLVSCSGQEGYKWLEQRLVCSLPLDSCDTLEDWLLEDASKDSHSLFIRQHLVDNIRMVRLVASETSRLYNI